MNTPIDSSDNLKLPVKEENQNYKINKASEPLRILIFIGSLKTGGKERRLTELLSYFRTCANFTFLIVLMDEEIHFQSFKSLNIPYEVIKKRYGSNLSIAFQLFQKCKEFRPDLIHTWGQMQTFYVLPAVVGLHIPLVNSQITSAPSKISKPLLNGLINKLNFRFSSVVIANSKAGFQSFNPPVSKRKLIYNGINLERFRNLPNSETIKTKYGLHTPYTVVMVASYSHTKDYNLFFEVAKAVTSIRNDITFLGVGGNNFSGSMYDSLSKLSITYNRIIFHEAIDDVEALVNACTIGVLFSTDGEGCSNSIMEYMALGKPVIANNAGGNQELVRHNENGFLTRDETADEIAALIISLIDNCEKYKSFAAVSKRIIEESYTLKKMGMAFEEVFKEVILNK